MAKPPKDKRFKKSPRTSKLRLRMQARRTAKNANRIVAPKLDDVTSDDVTSNTNKAVGDININNKATNNQSVLENSSQLKPPPNARADIMSIAMEGAPTNPLEGLTPVRSYHGERNEQREVRNAWNDYNTDPYYDLTRNKGEGFSYGGNTFKQNAAGVLQYREQEFSIDPTTGEEVMSFSAPRNMNTMDVRDIQAMNRELRRSRAEAFTKTTAYKKHEILSGDRYRYSPLRGDMQYNTVTGAKPYRTSVKKEDYYGKVD